MKTGVYAMMVLLLAVPGLVPAASAWHDVPDHRGIDASIPLEVGGPLLPSTGIIPVDRAVEIIEGNVELVGQTISATLTPVHREVQNQSASLDDVARSPITLFADGGGHGSQNGSEARYGGFGESRMMGGQPWVSDSTAGVGGGPGYRTPGNDSQYPGHTRSMMVLPAIDLRTNSAQEGRSGAHGVQSMTLRHLYWACDLAVQSPAAGEPAGVGVNYTDSPTQMSGLSVCLSYREMLERQDKTISMSYDITHNLALQEDGLAVLVFTEPPTSIGDVNRCERRPNYAPDSPEPRQPYDAVTIALDRYRDTLARPVVPPVPVVVPALEGVAEKKAHDDWVPFCRAVLPASGHDPNTAINGLPGGVGYTGQADWFRDAIDLTPWEGVPSVWVAFLFASSAIPGPDYFASPLLFPDSGLDVVGARVDNIKVQSAAAPFNLALRDMPEPGYPLEAGVPTLHPAGVIPVHATVTNLAGTPASGLVQATIANASDPHSPLARTAKVSFELGAAESLRVEFSIPASYFGDGRYLADLCIERSATTNTTAAGYCQSQRADGDCSADLANAAPCRQFMRRHFDIRPVARIEVGDASIGQQALQVGDTTLVRLPITNAGNYPTRLQVEPWHVNLNTGEVGQSLIAASARGPAGVYLEPAQQQTLVWPIVGAEFGQYRFIGLTNSSTHSQMPVNPEFDLRPAMLQPWTGQPLYDLPIIDGRLDDAIWAAATKVPLGNGDHVHVANTEDFLALALSNRTAGPASLVLAEDDPRGPLQSTARVIAIEVRNGAMREVNVTSDPDANWVARHDTDVQYATDLYDGEPAASRGVHEFLIPLNRSTGDSGLSATQGDIIHILVRACGYDDGRGVCPTYPANAPLLDGSGLVAANGDLTDEVAQWQPLRLADLARITPGPEAPFSGALKGPTFAVGTALPALADHHLSDCGAIAGWTHADVRRLDGPVQDKWNCHNFDDAGRVLLYKGLSPDSECRGGPCWPYSGDPDIGPRYPFEDRQVGQYVRHYLSAEYRPNVDHLWSAPIEIPGDAVRPTALLTHQFSTDVEINDLPDQYRPTNWIRTNHLMTAAVEAWDEEQGRWRDLGPIRPVNGFPSDHSLSIALDNGVSRTFMGTNVSIPEGPGEVGSWVDRDCPSAYENLRWAGDEMEATILRNFEDCVFQPDAPGWWHPQGDQMLFQPPGSSFPMGAYFHGGAAWATEQIPLYGEHFGTFIDLAGKTVRLRFTMETSERADNATSPDNDWGWRIGGLSVRDGAPALRDLAVEEAVIAASFDVSEMGVGPDSEIPLDVTIANRGLAPIEGARVEVTGTQLDGPGGAATVCRADKNLPGAIAIAEVRVVSLACTIATLQDGPVVFLAAATVPGDALPANNLQRVPGTYRVTVSPGAAMALEVHPTTGNPGIVRDFHGSITNTGNVAIRNATVVLDLYDATDAGVAPVRIERRSWRMPGEASVPVSKDPVALAQVLGLDGPVSFRPPYAGVFVATLTLTAPDTPGLEPVRVTATFQATTPFYFDSFDEPPISHEGGVVRGAIQSESDAFFETTAAAASRHIRIGHVGTGDIMAGGDATLDLPSLDLGALKEATLTFRHKYDLEQGFDGARAEMSLDGGATWQTLRPRPQPSIGLPGGYPDHTMSGASALIDGAIDCRQCAFTGRSADLAGVADGWVTAEFNLGEQPQFLRPGTIDQWPLDNLAAYPEATPTLTADGAQFTDDSWLLREPGAMGNGRLWSVVNNTFSAPVPHAGQNMLWSGSSGVPDPVQGGMPYVHTTVSFEAPPELAAADERDVLTVRFWDWRAGWAGLPPEHREGTGGKFTVLDLAGNQLNVTVLDGSDDGWTLREVRIPRGGAASPGVAFQYVSGIGPEAPLFCNGDPCHGHAHEYWAMAQDNRGWFLDDVEFSLLHASGETTSVLATENPDMAGHISVEPSAGGVAWSAVTSGASQRDGGWHIEQVSGPDPAEPRKAWSFSAAEAPEGYPAGADSHLVTPSVDLRRYAGSMATLNFDHWFALMGSQNEVQLGNPFLGNAADVASVEVQVLDETTGLYGPWKQIGATPEAPAVGVLNAAAGSPALAVDSLNTYARVMEYGYTSYTGSPILQEGRSYCQERDLPQRMCRSFGNHMPASPGRAGYAGSGQLYAPFEPPIDYPISHVFSGLSTDLYPETNGWNSVSWDVSHLIGTQFRIGFHVQTNPSDSPCLSGGWGTTFAGPGCHDMPLGGWRIANVSVSGQVYHGQPVDMRLRAATDASMEKGSWAIDDIALVGRQFRDTIRAEFPGGGVRGLPGDVATMTLDIRNIGALAHDRLAVALQATDRETGQPVILDVAEQSGLVAIAPAHLPGGHPYAVGSFALPSGGSRSISLSLPLGDGYTDVRAVMLQDQSTCDALSGACTPRYVEFRNEQGAGQPTAAAWAHGSNAVEISLVGLDDGGSARATPALSRPTVPGGYEPVSLEAHIHNAGGTEPTVSPLWTVQRLLQKGCAPGSQCSQPYTREIALGAPVPLPSVTLRLAPGATAATTADFTPSGPGLYRASLEVLVGESKHLETYVEFMVGSIDSYYHVDFAKDTFAESGWGTASLQRGARPAAMEFRQDGTEVRWGVSEMDFLRGLDYCSSGGCNDLRGNSGPVPRGYGIHSGIQSPPFNLRSVVSDDVFLVLSHSHRFTSGDGARVEIMPLRSTDAESASRAAFSCIGDVSGDRVDAWFRLTPDVPGALAGRPLSFDAYAYNTNPEGQSQSWYYLPSRNNALGDAPAIGGPSVEGEVLRFDLAAQEVEPVCPPAGSEEWFFEGEEPSSLLNYTARLRLRVGTTPGITDANCDAPANTIGCPDSPRDGSLGWSIGRVSVSSSSIGIEPGLRDLPIADGYEKRFNLRVSNHGPLEVTMTVGLGDAKQFSAPSHWFHFPVDNLTLAPNEARIVPVDVYVPSDENAERGRYTVQFRATSVHDSAVFSSTMNRIVLSENKLPILATAIAVQSEVAGEEPEPGAISQIVTTIHNIGSGASHEVPMVVWATELGGDAQSRGRVQLGSQEVPALAYDESVTLFTEWLPEAPGNYQIEAVVDPAQSMIQGVAPLPAVQAVTVRPPQRPNVEVNSLHISNVEADGYAREGALLTITANVTNRGPVAATGVTVYVLAGTAELTRVVIPSLAPGQSRDVQAARIASGTESVIRALVIPGQGPENRGDTEHEIRKIVRVRQTDIVLAAENEVLEGDESGRAIGPLILRNRGNAVERVALALGSEATGWSFAATPNPLILAPNSTARTILSVAAPLDAPAGNQTLRLVASNPSGHGPQTAVDVPVWVAERVEAPELAVISPAVQPGASTLQLHVRSVSNVNANVTLSMSPAWVANVSVALPAAKTVSIAVPLQVPPATPPGPVEVKMRVVDARGAEAESDMDLDVQSVARGRALWVPGGGAFDVDGTRQITERLTVFNTGNVPVDWRVSGERFGPGLRLDPPVTHGYGLPPGGNVTVPLSFFLDLAFIDKITGLVSVQSVVNGDADQQIAALPVPFGSDLPDLVIGDVRVAQEGLLRAGQAANLSVPVRNVGAQPSPATELVVFAQGLAVAATSVPAIEPGQTVRANVSWVPSAAGDMILQFGVDSNLTVDEARDDNNWQTLPVTVQGDEISDRLRGIPGVGIAVALLALAALSVARRRAASG